MTKAVESLRPSAAPPSVLDPAAEGCSHLCMPLLLCTSASVLTVAAASASWQLLVHVHSSTACLQVWQRGPRCRTGCAEPAWWGVQRGPPPGHALYGRAGRTGAVPACGGAEWHAGGARGAGVPGRWYSQPAWRRGACCSWGKTALVLVRMCMVEMGQHAGVWSEWQRG